MNYLTYVVDKAHTYLPKAVMDSAYNDYQDPHQQTYVVLQKARKIASDKAEQARGRKEFELAAVYSHDRAVFDDAIHDFIRLVTKMVKLKEQLKRQGELSEQELARISYDLMELHQVTRNQSREADNREKLHGYDSEVYIGDEEYKTQLQIVEASTLNAATNVDINQLRDRTRAASRLQVATMANKLAPKRLGDNSEISAGAPTLAIDGKNIIGGNGRVLAIKQAYEQGSKGQEYKQYLIDNAFLWGIDGSSVAKMDKPILIRVLQQEVDIQKAAVASNESSGLAMSDLENAKVDGERLPDLDLFHITENGEINNPQNEAFIRQFIANLPVTVQAVMVDSYGKLNKTGVSRLKNALIYRAYGSSPSLARMIESLDEGLKNIATALTQLAPTVAYANKKIDDSLLHNRNIAEYLQKAASLLNEAKEDGQDLNERLSQMDFIDGEVEPEVKLLANMLESNKRSVRKIVQFVQGFYQMLEQYGNPQQDDFLITDDPPSTLEMLQTVEQINSNQSDLF